MGNSTDRPLLPRGRRARKALVRGMLVARNLTGLVELAERDRRAEGPLFSLLYDGDPLIRWRAVEGLGRVTGVFSELGGLEAARGAVRKVLWAMNDESGGLIWNGPEAIAEILANVPTLMGEYAEQLPSFYREEPFERGAHWAVARLAGLRPGLFEGRADELIPSLANPDPFIRGFSGLALWRIRGGAAAVSLAVLRTDVAPLEHYDLNAGVLRPVSVNVLIAADGFK